MLPELFNWLSNTLNASPGMALLASFIWGVLGILLSPCHLASIPLIVGFISGQGRVSAGRAFSLSALFSAGILITIALIGLITSFLGRMLGDLGPAADYTVAAVFFVVGLHMLGVIRLPFLSGSAQPKYEKRGLFAAFILGLIFGVALGPCTFAYMAPMLGIAFSAAAENLVFAVSLVLAYAAGHVSVIILAGTFTETVQNYLNWNERSKGIEIMKKICGALVIAGGAYILFS